MFHEYSDIIVAVDGSEESKKAFNKSLAIAKSNQARLILTHIIDTRSYGTTAAYDSTLASQAEENADKLLSDYSETAKNAGIEDIVKCMEYGSPKVKIAKDIAKSFDADLIVCGATGMNAVEHFLIGSVSENIARYAKCDVFIVR